MHILARRFSWIDNIIWKEDLGIKGEKNYDEGRNITIVLSSKDLIMDTEIVGQYLLGSILQGNIVEKEAPGA